MGYPDDPTNTPSRQMKTLGMGDPSRQMPLPIDPMAGFKKQFSDLASTAQQVGQVTNAPAPKPAPLLGPDAGSSILPVLRGVDGAMRSAGSAVSNAPIGAGNVPGEIAYTGGKLMDTVLGGVFGADYQRERTGPKGVDADPFAYRGGSIPVPPPAPAPVSAPASAGPTKDNGYAMPEIAANPPTAGTQQLIAQQNASRTPVSDPYAGPAAGMPVPGAQGTAGTIGVEGLQRQLQNIRALEASTPQGGFNSLPDYAEQQNAKSSAASMAENLKSIGSPRLREAVASMYRQQMANDSAANTANITQQGHLQGIGMQLPVTMRGQDLQAQTAHEGQQVQSQGQHIQAQVAREGHQVQSQGQRLTADTSLRNAELQAQTAAAGNVSAENRTGMMVEGQLGAAKVHADATKAASTNRYLGAPDGSLVNPVEGKVYRPAGKDKQGNPTPAGFYPLPTFELLPKKDDK